MRAGSSWVLLLLAAASTLAADPRSACIGKSLAETISCLENTSPPNLAPSKSAISLPDACKALARWRRLLEGAPDQPDKVASDQSKVTTMLQTGCTQQENLRIADHLRRQRRFGEALDFYDRIKEGALPEVAERARRGRILSSELKNALVLPPPAVVELERQGQFKEAYDLLSKAAPESNSHRQNLALLLALQEVGPALEKRNEHEALLKAYGDFLGK